MDLHKLIFGTRQDKEPSETDDAVSLQTAVAALLIEMACIDDEFDEREEAIILAILKSKFDLSDEEASELTRQAQEAREKSIDLYSFTKQINSHFPREEKIKMMDLLWDIVYADGRLDGHEDYLIHTLTNMLNLDHQDMIDSKLRASEKSKES